MSQNHVCISSDGLKGLSKNSLLYKLRWVTLGYHYDWNTKVLCRGREEWRRRERESEGSLPCIILYCVVTSSMGCSTVVQVTETWLGT